MARPEEKPSLRNSLLSGPFSVSVSFAFDKCPSLEVAGEFVDF